MEPLSDQQALVLDHLRDGWRLVDINADRRADRFAGLERAGRRKRVSRAVIKALERRELIERVQTWPNLEYRLT